MSNFLNFTTAGNDLTVSFDANLFEFETYNDWRDVTTSVFLGHLEARELAEWILDNAKVSE